MLNQFLLFLKLYYKPSSAMSSIIDTGSLMGSIIAVILVAIPFCIAITTPIYDYYEATTSYIPKYHQPKQQQVKHSTTTNDSNINSENGSNKGENLEKNEPIIPSVIPTPVTINTPITKPVTKPIDTINDEADYEEQPTPLYSRYPQYMSKKPLPLIGQYGWWFLSFSRNITLVSVLSLSLLYVPITILILLFFEPLGSFGVVFRRDFAPLLACTLMSWAATHLPFSLIALALQQSGQITPEKAFIFWVMCKLSFAIFMVLALRVVFNVSLTSIIGTLSISWLSIILQSMIFWITSPFLLFWIYYYLRGDIGTVGADITSSFRQRQSFRRSLEAATINPQDAEAHYQLGLIYQQRRQYTEAITRFKKAVEIDRREIDAHFQLGVIAREQNRLQEAISHFDAVVSLNEKHSNYEVWREIGATYEAANMNLEAREALEKYVERRSYDAEGLYYYGKTLSKLGENNLAKEILNRCLEAVDTAPYHRRGQLRRWYKMAQSLLRNLT